MDPLRNYRTLLEKVDTLCRSIESRYADAIACRKGCDSCCRHLTLSSVEAAALTAALAELSPDRLDALLSHVTAAPADSCPLLADGSCLLYDARPLICRTHGLPLLIGEGEGKRTDCCPLNFNGLGELPGDAVVDLEKLNAVLTGVNLLYARETGADPDSRVSVASVICRLR